MVKKRLIEVDDDKLDEVRALLGTRTLKATVDAALGEVLADARSNPAGRRIGLVVISISRMRETR